MSVPLPLGLMAFGGFAIGAGMRLLDPLLPMIAVGFGTTVAGAAILIAAFALPYGAGQIATGPLGDRLGKVRVASFALIAYGLVSMASALAQGLTDLTIMRALAGLFAGAVIPLMMAHIGDSVPYEDRQAAIGRFLTGMVFAQMLAGPMSGVLGENFGWRASFLAAGGLAVGAGGLMAWKLLRGAPPPVPSGAGMFSGFGKLLRARAGRKLLMLAGLNGALLFGGAFPFVASFLIERFGLSAAEAGLVMAGFGAGAFLYTRIAKRLVRRFGERGLLGIGGAALMGLLLLISVAWAWWVVLVAQLCIGLAFFMFHGVLQARATEALPEARGTAVSAFAMALFLGQTVGTLVFAGVIAWGDYRVAFALAGVGVGGLAWWARKAPSQL
ncbi:MFS transporter [Roseococcus suduntuyensis]|uniref:Putative MFS family arabinose efflux permease n=1 Tax=Roseococcus suduntuyensis TaxID=455361 RepID=A0A840A628_9PROT|nr:MFS transporter [Roseococcus suduntuyensis]MBB3896607.1 putative MFS family arabinose efflux permease [Roseococcus suduntuyensis]